MLRQDHAGRFRRAARAVSLEQVRKFVDFCWLDKKRVKVPSKTLLANVRVRKAGQRDDEKPFAGEKLTQSTELGCSHELRSDRHEI
jgi:hypothetical protein